MWCYPPAPTSLTRHTVLPLLRLMLDWQYYAKVINTFCWASLLPSLIALHYLKMLFFFMQQIHLSRISSLYNQSLLSVCLYICMRRWLWNAWPEGSLPPMFAGIKMGRVPPIIEGHCYILTLWSSLWKGWMQGTTPAFWPMKLRKWLTSTTQSLF